MFEPKLESLNNIYRIASSNADDFKLTLKVIGINIAKFRRQKVLTQHDLSVQTGINRRYIQSIEAGRINLTLITLFRIAKALSIDVVDLMLSDDLLQ